MESARAPAAAAWDSGPDPFRNVSRRCAKATRRSFRLNDMNELGDSTRLLMANDPFYALFSCVASRRFGLPLPLLAFHIDPTPYAFFLMCSY